MSKIIHTKKNNKINIILNFAFKNHGHEDNRPNVLQHQLNDYTIYADQVMKFREDLSNSK
jgi:hypothetical protein